MLLDLGKEVKRMQARKIQAVYYRDFDNLSSYFLYGNDSNRVEKRDKWMKRKGLGGNEGAKSGDIERGLAGGCGDAPRCSWPDSKGKHPRYGGLAAWEWTAKGFRVEKPARSRWTDARLLLGIQ